MWSGMNVVLLILSLTLMMEAAESTEMSRHTRRHGVASHKPSVLWSLHRCDIHHTAVASGGCLACRILRVLPDVRLHSAGLVPSGQCYKCVKVCRPLPECLLYHDRRRLEVKAASIFSLEETTRLQPNHCTD